MSSIVIEQKISKMENILKKQMNQKPVTPKMHQRVSSSINFSKKTVAYIYILYSIDEMKKGCLNKYISHQVGKRQKDLDDAKKIVDR